ncbi:hypothetical protein ACFX13_008989 [Malus domestica]
MLIIECINYENCYQHSKEEFAGEEVEDGLLERYNNDGNDLRSSFALVVGAYVDNSTERSKCSTERSKCDVLGLRTVLFFMTSSFKFQ